MLAPKKEKRRLGDVGEPCKECVMSAFNPVPSGRGGKRERERERERSLQEKHHKERDRIPPERESHPKAIAVQPSN
jgi:hypothetical protein